MSARRGPVSAWLEEFQWLVGIEGDLVVVGSESDSVVVPPVVFVDVAGVAVSVVVMVVFEILEDAVVFDDP
jgi:hypothetical protein